MKNETFIEKREESIAPHIFSVSAGMVGVCLTVIGIINIIASYSHGTKTIADDVTLLDAILFLFTCFLSYTAIKTKDRKSRLKLELIADICFLTALFVMVVVCLLIVYCFYSTKV